ncbi:hypothetical protein [Arenibacterium sp. LLYu02]|uniref:hypothetical protein n=1 Tax=Arenibacterium sp. LLYu02 TaxID=3404132 RepID=UPI003B21F27C
MSRIAPSILTLPLPMLVLAATLTLFPQHLRANETTLDKLPTTEVQAALRGLFEKKGFRILDLEDTDEGILLTAQHEEEVYTFAISDDFQVMRIEQKE